MHLHSLEVATGNFVAVFILDVWFGHPKFSGEFSVNQRRIWLSTPAWGPV